jgi:hypothetical protein
VVIGGGEDEDEDDMMVAMIVRDKDVVRRQYWNKKLRMW